MNKVPLNTISEDSFLNAKLFLDDKYILLSPEIPFSEEIKKRLAKWNFNEIYMVDNPVSEDTISDEPGRVASSAVIANRNPEEIRKEKETLEYYQGCLRFLNDIYDRFQLDNTLKISAISEKIKEMKTFTHANRRYILSIPDKSIEGVSYNVSHSVKTTFLSLILSDPLKLSIHRQIELGVTALLHRIGMLKLPPNLYMADRKLNPAEKKALNTYPVLSFRILKNAGFPMNIAVGVLDHMERMDGTGYPRNLTGEKISPYGKIVGITSSYVAATAKRPYKKGMDGHSGILDLIKLSGTAYDQGILKILVYTLSIYPIGTFVELTTGAKGIVIKTDPENPKMPFIKMIIDPEGKPYPELPIFRPGTDDTTAIKRPLSAAEKKDIEKVYKID